MALSFPPWPPILSRNIFLGNRHSLIMPENFFQSSFHSFFIFPIPIPSLFSILYSLYLFFPAINFFHALCRFCHRAHARDGVAFAHCRNLIFRLTEMLYSKSILNSLFSILYSLFSCSLYLFFPAINFFHALCRFCHRAHARDGVACAHCRNLIFRLTEMLYSKSILNSLFSIFVLPCHKLFPCLMPVLPSRACARRRSICALPELNISAHGNAL